ncbi:MAG: glucuronate isomerase [Pirellulaceae bacterium]|jgi:glucuronate isomerase|nr:amidohydrolase [Planctomycetaceae bacterium]MBT6722564.1 amidohydrolase [Planctomycetaceae bacterium]MDB4863500.1 glucuronate isomerase [Pirellulaceae bacterium]
MSTDLRNRLFEELDSLVLIDPHTHIDALSPASKDLSEILGYHYYTELAHSAGLPRQQIEAPGITPREKVGLLLNNLKPIQNTIQYSWLIEMCQKFFGFEGEIIDGSNWEAIYDAAQSKMVQSDWSEQVLEQSGIEAVFLTNDFDDSLEGFDSSVYIPCLRTDDLVFHLAKPAVRERLEICTNISLESLGALTQSLEHLFTHFTRENAKACAISLPPWFVPTEINFGEAEKALEQIQMHGEQTAPEHKETMACWVFWKLAELCDEFRLPFDLMIGVNRSVYPGGVYQGMDLYDSRVSLIQYADLFNAFPAVKFPISVLASVTNQELASYSWIFPNVITNGHWWYSNTPTFIEHDTAARLEAVPQTKQIGYYSDMYKLEFALPKFAMYKRMLAKVLAERYVIDRNWNEERAIDFGKRILRGNIETIFNV